MPKLFGGSSKGKDPIDAPGSSAKYQSSESLPPYQHQAVPGPLTSPSLRSTPTDLSFRSRMATSSSAAKDPFWDTPEAKASQQIVNMMYQSRRFYSGLFTNKYSEERAQQFPNHDKEKLCRVAGRHIDTLHAFKLGVHTITSKPPTIVKGSGFSRGLKIGAQMLDQAMNPKQTLFAGAQLPMNWDHAVTIMIDNDAHTAAILNNPRHDEYNALRARLGLLFRTTYDCEQTIEILPVHVSANHRPVFITGNDFWQKYEHDPLKVLTDSNVMTLPYNIESSKEDIDAAFRSFVQRKVSPCFARGASIPNLLHIYSSVLGMADTAFFRNSYLSQLRKAVAQSGTFRQQLNYAHGLLSKEEAMGDIALRISNNPMALSGRDAVNYSYYCTYSEIMDNEPTTGHMVDSTNLKPEVEASNSRSQVILNPQQNDLKAIMTTHPGADESDEKAAKITLAEHFTGNHSKYRAGMLELACVAQPAETTKYWSSLMMNYLKYKGDNAGHWIPGLEKAYEDVAARIKHYSEHTSPFALPTQSSLHQSYSGNLNPRQLAWLHAKEHDMHVLYPGQHPLQDHMHLPYRAFEGDAKHNEYMETKKAAYTAFWNQQAQLHHYTGDHTHIPKAMQMLGPHVKELYHDPRIGMEKQALRPQAATASYQSALDDHQKQAQIQHETAMKAAIQSHAQEAHNKGDRNTPTHIPFKGVAHPLSIDQQDDWDNHYNSLQRAARRQA